MLPHEIHHNHNLLLFILSDNEISDVHSNLRITKVMSFIFMTDQICQVPFTVTDYCNQENSLLMCNTM
jgi:hypothetical protein